VIATAPCLCVFVREFFCAHHDDCRHHEHWGRDPAGHRFDDPDPNHDHHPDEQHPEHPDVRPDPLDAVRYARDWRKKSDPCGQLHWGAAHQWGVAREHHPAGDEQAVVERDCHLAVVE
jgi:hypothetical protein